MIKRTAFYDIHKSLGAKIITFAGFEMPVQYEGIIAEHLVVRNSVGMFDISHMGEFIVKGKDALSFIQKVTTNDASKLTPGKVQYTAACYDDGGIVDDLLVYCFDSYYMMVVNASNIEKDFLWFKKFLNGDAELINVSDDYSLIAVQGRNSLPALQKLTNVNLSGMKYYSFIENRIGDTDVIISRTGYTGESMGFEIYTNSDKNNSEKLWNLIFEAGKEFNIKPVGLGARDTLRLEAGYCLYGNDIDNTTNPIEAGLGWITKTVKPDFNGRQKIISQLENGISRKLCGFILSGRSVARNSNDIFCDSEKIGYVTSGNLSPILNKNIGLGYLKKEFTEPEMNISIKIRDNFVDAEVVKTPFI